jgi:hypothetical protein
MSVQVQISKDAAQKAAAQALPAAVQAAAPLRATTTLGMRSAASTDSGETGAAGAAAACGAAAAAGPRHGSAVHARALTGLPDTLFDGVLSPSQTGYYGPSQNAAATGGAAGAGTAGSASRWELAPSNVNTAGGGVRRELALVNTPPQLTLPPIVHNGAVRSSRSTSAIEHGELFAASPCGLPAQAAHAAHAESPAAMPAPGAVSGSGAVLGERPSTGKSCGSAWTAASAASSAAASVQESCSAAEESLDGAPAVGTHDAAPPTALLEAAPESTADAASTSAVTSTRVTPATAAARRGAPDSGGATPRAVAAAVRNAEIRTAVAGVWQRCAGGSNGSAPLQPSTQNDAAEQWQSISPEQMAGAAAALAALCEAKGLKFVRAVPAGGVDTEQPPVHGVVPAHGRSGSVTRQQEVMLAEFGRGVAQVLQEHAQRTPCTAPRAASQGSPLQCASVDGTASPAEDEGPQLSVEDLFPLDAISRSAATPAFADRLVASAERCQFRYGVQQKMWWSS